MLCLLSAFFSKTLGISEILLQILTMKTGEIVYFKTLKESSSYIIEDCLT